MGKYNLMVSDSDQIEFLSNRAKMFIRFAPEVLDHIECYTIPQYGDFPNDQVAGWSILDLKPHIQSMVNRIGSGQRGPEEAERDALKLAHYACMLWHKVRNEEKAYK